MDPLAVLTNDTRITLTLIYAFHWQLLATFRATMMPSACSGVALDFPSSGGSGVMNAVDLLILLTLTQPYTNMSIDNFQHNYTLISPIPKWR